MDPCNVQLLVVCAVCITASVLTVTECMIEDILVVFCIAQSIGPRRRLRMLWRGFLRMGEEEVALT